MPYIGELELSKVDGGVLNALYGQLLSDGRTGASGRTGGLSPKTVRNLHGMLHRAFADAVKWRRLTVNPSSSTDQPRKTLPSSACGLRNRCGAISTACAVIVSTGRGASCSRPDCDEASCSDCAGVTSI